MLLQHVMYRKSVPVHGTKDYEGSEETAPLILNQTGGCADRRDGMKTGEEKNQSKRDSSFLHPIT